MFLSAVVLAAEPNFKRVEHEIKSIESEISAHVGVTVFETKNKEIWSYKGEERVPLTSTFKSIACAKLLYDADKEKTSLSRTVTVKKEDLVTYSPVTEKYIGKQLTLGEACRATMLTSDNTAANIVISAVGGPSEIIPIAFYNYHNEYGKLDARTRRNDE